MKMSKMRILITGGAGFLGSHLCEKLHSEGHTILCVDDLSTGRLKNVEHLLEKDYFYFFNQDVCNLQENSLFGKIDQIYCLASPASPAYYHQHPLKTFNTNVLGLTRCLELALKNNAKLLFSSTSEIYGEPLEHPQKEEYRGNVDPTSPRSVYDEAKRSGETLVSVYRNDFNLDAKIIRIFNTYGPRMSPDDGRVVSNFITQMIQNKPITVYGNGQQTRSFCYVDDLIDGIVRVMNSGESGPLNLGNPREEKVIDLISIIQKLIDSKSEIIHLSLPKDDPSRRCPDISKISSKLSWSPKVDLEDGLRKTVDYFYTELNNERNRQE